jgi:formyltetrahydrofolate deformylase
MSIYVGLIACADRPGLVHQITGVLYNRKVNVTENEEYVDHRAGRFFMRTQFEGAVNPAELASELKRLLPADAHCQVRELAPRRLVVMASREPHCLGDLLVRHATGELNAEILAVISQHEDARQLTERFDLKFLHVPVEKERHDHERKILKEIDSLKPDYLVLARYMRIFTKTFVSRFPQRILNIHHSFLPAFIGKDPYFQAYERGVKVIGATAHFVTEDLDEGPIIMQDVIHVDHTCSAESMAKRGQDIEKLVLARALNLVLEDRVLIEGNRTIVFS